MPDYPLWTAAINLSGGKAVHYLCDEENGWNPSIEDIRAKVSANTKGIVLINPNNPTGAVYSEEILREIVAIAEEHGLVIFADEIYDKILYEDAKHIPIATLVESTLCVTFNGMSKAYRAAGFRSGWMILSGNLEIARGYLEGLEMLSSMRLCANVPAQYTIQTALGGYQSIYDKNRLHYALTKGHIQASRPTFVRVHVQNTLGDLFHADLRERTHTLQEALQRLAQEPDGIIVVLDDAQSHNDIISRMVAFSHNNPPPKRPQEQDLRTYGIGAQILIDQGVGKMRLLSAPYKFTGISGYQLEVSEYLAE